MVQGCSGVRAWSVRIYACSGGTTLCVQATSGSVALGQHFAKEALSSEALEEEIKAERVYISAKNRSAMTGLDEK